MSPKRLKVGLVGTGAIAQIVHLPLLKELPGVRLEALCDIDEKKAGAIARRLDVPHVFDRTEDLFASDAVDAVVICSPSHLHHSQAIAALEAGKHVLVERPLAIDPAGAEAAVQAAERADRVLLVAYNNRFRPDTRGVKSFVESGELGDVFSIHGTWFNRKVRPKRLTWRHRKETAGGGAFMDLGLQVLDLCMWTLDYPRVERVSAHLHPGEGFEVEDAAAVLLRLADGTAVSVQVTWSLYGERDRHHIRIFGTGGSASTEPLKVHRETEHGVLDVTPQIAPGRENAYTASYREELRQFAAAALGGWSPDPPREQIELMRIASKVYESADKGKELKL
ncbi:MAG: Gfo/Idh/MocA family oxidoreductase [Gemmatimonadetes bacterium]|nr:Gfo/Idh/MocA family oxidoreductase [Gemmatimonadota bacterium]NIQ58663.1 Gfo/Idh/MocA family oxidoreductase [Gemmatimonadota bacterium]NIU78856.1 Gfo/Idh/MocA family oxidoreductase [Gammaproteobacteria bacterium]NIX47643.1 Gfo/Idh/MocA family oxidoreductase [Gemmatimonadota bacterium]NIY12002.1 Gfo/Idh/MocA family oxidoreductase [Gemmatimonadota bacterium]